MKNKQIYTIVFAICFSIIISATIIAYRPQKPDEDDVLFRYPAGIPPSLGQLTSTKLSDIDVNAIHVSGSGSSSKKATQATLTLGVMTENPSASTAMEENAESMSAVIDAIIGLGIQEEDIKTITYSVNPQYDWEKRETTGYRVMNLAQVKIKDLEIVGEVIDEAAQSGANEVQGISFGLSDEDIEALKNDAYTKALKKARDKADLISQTLDLEITGVLSVTENVYQPYTPYRGFAEAGDMATTTPILEGSLSVSVTVQVAFSFQ